MAAFSFLSPGGGATRNFIQRLSRSRFFTLSVALHFVFVLSFGSIVLVRQAAQRTDFDDPGGSLVTAPPPSAPDPVQALTQPTADTVSNTVPLASNQSLHAIETLGNNAAFSLPSTQVDPVLSKSRTFALEAGAVAAAQPKINGLTPAIARGIAQFTQGWRASNDNGNGVGKNRAFKFTAYLAKYAGGDWGSTVKVGKDGKITFGSLSNLLFIIRKWSHDKIEAEPDAVPMDLASDELFTHKPPFVLFTGHRDFKLTEQEVANLQKYLQLGGAVWGDSSLPGQRSRFDIAFRREMKRVLPDQDIAWETLPSNHPIFTQTYFPEIRGVPPGMNGYQEPVYALKNAGEIAVIYTANDYGDMWQIGITEQGKYDLSRTENNAFASMNYEMYENRGVYYRGLEENHVTDSYKFGTNIILHLLTRWEDKLRNVPTGL